MTGHRLDRDYPLPSGYRARCSCGVTVRGIDRADAMAAFLEHSEAEHLQSCEPVEDQR